MAALPPRPARRRPRPGSLERPVSGRLYRGTWLLVGIPLLLATFTVRKADPLPVPQPSLPATFDRAGALTLARELSGNYPDRVPGTAGAAGAVSWFAQQLAPYGLQPVAERFRADLPGRGTQTLVNQVLTIPGRLPSEIVVMAHRDDNGTGPGANDNASGIAAVLELARSYGTPVAAPGSRALSPLHTLVFVATDGGAFGALGARHFAATHEGHVLAVVDLDAIAARAPPRLVLAGTEARLASPGIVETASERILEQTGERPNRPSALAQLIDLAFPFTLHEQGPLLARGLPALTLTTGGERPPPAFFDRPSRLDANRLGELGRAAQQLLSWLDSGVELAPGTASYVYFGPRILPGWAIELVLIAALAPFLVAAVDLFARCRRRHIPLAPALRSYRSRAYFWLWTVAIFELFALVDVWPSAPAVPLPPDSPPASDWPVFGLLGLALLGGIGWFVTRERLLPRRPVAPSEELAGTAAALLALGVIALLVVATNPFALIFLLPSLHAWLWLPHFRGRPFWTRAALLLAGFVGPLLLVGSFALRFGLGLDSVWYLAELAATGYAGLPALVIAAGWLAAAGQVAALAAGRYAPYPDARERPPRGPIRETVRRTVQYSESEEARIGLRGTGIGRTRMSLKRSIRIGGTGLIVAGLLMLAWVAVVWRWQDPFTALYTHWKQHQLAHSYEHRFAAYHPRVVTRTESVAAEMGTIKREARRYRLNSHRGQAIGRIRVPRLGLKMILVNGTDNSTLRKGPGRDLRTYMPGEGQLIYIAGHRTTYLAPFAHIDKIRMGDSVTLEVPYGTFRYRIFRRRIVDANDLAVLHSHGREVVALQACHPRFFATNRYIVWARLVKVQPRGGRGFRAPVTVLAAAPLAAVKG